MKSPPATFSIFSRQDATFYFLNVAPQWKKFNSGNWLALELKIRAFAQDNEVGPPTYSHRQQQNFIAWISTTTISTPNPSSFYTLHVLK